MHFFSHKSSIALTMCTLSFSAALYAESPKPVQLIPPEKEVEPSPWLTGPLLTPSGRVIPDGHYNIEPYEYVTTNFGRYDANWHAQSTPNSYNLVTQVPVQYGLPCDFDITFTPSWAWNHTSGASHWVLNDLNVGFDYQLLYSKRGKWWPSIKLAVRALLPIGKYQKLHPKSKRTDLGGGGTWDPSVGLVFAHLFWFGGNFFFAPRINIQYTIPNSVHVKNFNNYGGGHHTNGTVYPGQTLTCQFGYEFSLSQRWALAGDIQYNHQSKTRFKGRKGATAGVPNPIGPPSNEQWSLAPAIEYNWNDYYGIIAGAWFTVGGRNSTEFASAVVAFNIYH
jgi:hypothetical protein